jgi:DNA-binding response OmpR family regulator
MPPQTILVAEDDRAIRELLTHHLEREGFTVIGAGDGHAALRYARAAADLVVLDVGLPGVDGYDVARTLRREERSVPIVMLTARSDEIDRVLGFELGADDYISKRSCSIPKNGRRVPSLLTIRPPTVRARALATTRFFSAGTLLHWFDRSRARSRSLTSCRSEFSKASRVV